MWTRIHFHHVRRLLLTCCQQIENDTRRRFKANVLMLRLVRRKGSGEKPHEGRGKGKFSWEIQIKLNHKYFDGSTVINIQASIDTVMNRIKIEFWLFAFQRVVKLKTKRRTIALNCYKKKCFRLRRLWAKPLLNHNRLSRVEKSQKSELVLETSEPKCIFTKQVSNYF